MSNHGLGGWLCKTIFFILVSCPALAVSPVREISPDVWLVEDHTLPIITVRIMFEGAGAAYDPAQKQGLASFASQLLDEGAGTMDSLAFNRALEDNAIRFNAGVDEDALTVSVQSLSDYKGRAFELLHLALSRPRFDTDAVERIRASILSDLKEEEADPNYVASLNWKRLAFPHHPYALPRRGTPQSVAAVTRDDLVAYSQSHIACSHKRVVVVGDIAADEVKRWAQTLAPACADAPALSIADVSVADGGTAPVVIPMPVPQTVVAASLPGVLRSDPRFYAVELLNNILGGSTLTSRLGKEIRDKRGLAYYADSQQTDLDHTGYLEVQFATRNALTYDAVSVMRDVLAEISARGVTAQELADAKSYLTGSFALQIDTQGALAGYLLGMQHYHLGANYLEKRNHFIDAVTLEQVNAAARDLLSHPPLIVMAGSPESKKP